MRFKQVAVVQATEGHAASIVALSEDGRLFVYSASIFVTDSSSGVREKIIVDKGGWERIPDPPLNITE
jgi:hypothetical protein